MSAIYLESQSNFTVNKFYKLLVIHIQYYNKWLHKPISSTLPGLYIGLLHRLHSGYRLRERSLLPLLHFKEFNQLLFMVQHCSTEEIVSASVSSLCKYIINWLFVIEEKNCKPHHVYTLHNFMQKRIIYIYIYIYILPCADKTLYLMFWKLLRRAILVTSLISLHTLVIYRVWS